MQKSKSKAAYTIVIVLSIIAILLMLLKITGAFDITTLFRNSLGNPNIQDGRGGYFIDEWVSEPFGELDVTLSFTSYDNGFIRTKLQSGSERFDEQEYDWFYKDSEEMVISEVTYDIPPNYVSLMDGGIDIKTGMVYTGFAVPLDCEKILLDGNETIPQKASINTTVGEIEFKVCTLTYFDDEDNPNNHEFILIDKGGNEHLIKPF
ncbi:MAG: hypothetical protein K2G56_06175 [Eubacterium sp.]|nr:hypothetical protein [Eubacterium sp.]